jgi:hypothetical protein
MSFGRLLRPTLCGIACFMAVSVEMQHIGDSSAQAQVRAAIEHAFADRPGDWRVSTDRIR